MQRLIPQREPLVMPEIFHHVGGGAEPQAHQGLRSDKVPVRPNPAPMTWRVGTGIPASVAMSVTFKSPLACCGSEPRLHAPGANAHPRTAEY